MVKVPRSIDLRGRFLAFGPCSFLLPRCSAYGSLGRAKGAPGQRGRCLEFVSTGLGERGGRCLTLPLGPQGPTKSRKRAAGAGAGGASAASDATPSAGALLAMQHDVVGAAGGPAGMLEALPGADGGGGASAYFRPLAHDPLNSSVRQSARDHFSKPHLSHSQCASNRGYIRSEISGSDRDLTQRISSALDLGSLCQAPAAAAPPSQDRCPFTYGSEVSTAQRLLQSSA